MLLISCADAAGLLLSQAARRAREIAIKAALGARRGQIIHQLLAESVLLSAGSGIPGLALGYVGMRTLLAVSPAGIPRIGAGGSGVALDWRIFLFTLIISVFTGILFGLAPALAASRPDVGSLARDAASQSGMGFRRGRGRALLVISETALALVLLAAARAGRLLRRRSPD